jgi:hypothetical protein
MLLKSALFDDKSLRLFTQFPGLVLSKSSGF